MKIKLLITFFIAIFSNSITKAQFQISGKISDKASSQPIIGGSVNITDLKRGNSTDLNGFYKIENFQKGTYLFEISFVGYKNIVQKITVDSNNQSLNFELNESPTELNEVVVTGVTRSTEINQSPVIIKQIDMNKLNQSSASNLIDALKNIPGVSQISTGASISKPTIRGLGYNRVISLMDGIRQEGQQWGDEHGIEIDEYGIDRIEIVKGPGSLLYGSDGIAGVINFISPKAPHDGEINIRYSANYQTNNQLIANSLSVAGNKNNVQWMVRGTAKLAGNYENKYDGKVLNSGFKEYDGAAFLGFNKKWGYSHFNFSSYNTKVGLVEGDRDNLGKFTFEIPNSDGSSTLKSADEDDLSGYKIGIPNQEINHIRLTNNNYFLLKKGTINFDLGFQNNKRKEFADIFNLKTPELFFDLSSLNYNIRYNLIAKNGWEGSLGVGGMYQQNKNKGEEFIIPEYNLFDVGTYFFTQKTFSEKFTLAGGLRIDNRNIKTKKLEINEGNSLFTKFEAINKNYSSFSGSAGISYQLNKVSNFKLNLSRGFRAPNIAEISSNGRHEGTFRYEIGNPNLKPEISQQIDLGYFLNADHITFEVTPFINRISNYIFAEKLTNVMGGDSIPDFDDGAPAYQFVQNNAILVGGEVYLDVHPHPLDWLHIENSFSFVQAAQINRPDSLKYLPFIPAPKYRIELKSAFKKWGDNISNIYIKVALDHIFAQNKYFKAYNTETATPTYTLLSAGAGANVKGFGNANFLNIFVSAENLTNIAYQSHLSRLKYAPENPLTGREGVYNMGRNVSLKLIFNM